MKKDLAALRYIDDKSFPYSIVETYRYAEDTVDAAEFSFSLFLKRLIDLSSALFVLVFGLPFYLLLAAFIKLTSEGPVLFKQERIGQNGRRFKFYKFRTMTEQRDINGRLLVDSHRLPPFGRILRKNSMDELPELFNVLKGDMSLVGPRPLLMK